MNQVRNFENWFWEGKDQELVSRHHSALDQISSGPVLDLGCGDGLLLLKLKEKNIEGEGLDISDVAVKKCMSRGLKARIFDFSSGRLPYKDRTFKWVVMTDVLEHLYDSKNVLREAGRVGDNVLIVVPNFNSLTARLQTLMGKVPENNTPKKGHIYWFNKKVLLKLINDCDLNVVAITPQYYKTDSILARLFRVLGGVFPSILSLSFTVVARR